MDPITLLLAIALILFIFAALPIPSSPINLGWAGAAFLTAAFLFD